MKFESNNENMFILISIDKIKYQKIKKIKINKVKLKNIKNLNIIYPLILRSSNRFFKSYLKQYIKILNNNFINY